MLRWMMLVDIASLKQNVCEIFKRHNINLINLFDLHEFNFQSKITLFSPFGWLNMSVMQFQKLNI
jgi:hypothetical protein